MLLPSSLSIVCVCAGYPARENDYRGCRFAAGIVSNSTITLHSKSFFMNFTSLSSMRLFTRCFVSSHGLLHRWIGSSVWRQIRWRMDLSCIQHSTLRSWKLNPFTDWTAPLMLTFLRVLPIIRKAEIESILLHYELVEGNAFSTSEGDASEKVE